MSNSFWGGTKREKTCLKKVGLAVFTSGSRCENVPNKHIQQAGLRFLNDTIVVINMLPPDSFWHSILAVGKRIEGLVEASVVSTTSITNKGGLDKSVFKFKGHRSRFHPLTSS